ncbi:hypothetical protein [Streptomyces sp. NPDC127197]|uniref:hypothetical protein n=1 Tax=Streptomyces sp. NPDC127197 TaxID=3345388 RepID=UPI0036439598
MIHSEESVAAELDRVRQRPPAEAAPPVLAAFTVDVTAPPAEYAERVRQVLAAALHLACTAEFDDQDLPTDRFPDWFTRVSGRGEESGQELARDGRAAFLAKSGKVKPWRLQNWIYRFHPDEDSRGWEFWDVVPVGPSQVRVWVDSWGESFFGSLELLWLLYTAGATHVEGPEVHKVGVWVSEARGL